MMPRKFRDPLHRASFNGDFGLLAMIRFTCDTCGRSLRAPESLAGKRGKCARCGGVNRVPEVLSVDVKRAPEASPFRNADVPSRAAIEGAIELAGSRFLAVADRAIDGNAHPRDFYEQIAPRLDERAVPPQANSAATVNVPPPSPRRTIHAPGRAHHHPLESRAPHTGDAYDLRLDGRSAEFSRAIIAALVVGAVVGFCLGLLASRWIL
jgi:hypothetical protein